MPPAWAIQLPGQPSDGGIDFAGTDPNTIRSDIKAAALTHVISIAAGNDRAIATGNRSGVVLNLVPLLMVCCSPVMATTDVWELATGSEHIAAHTVGGPAVAWERDGSGWFNVRDAQTPSEVGPQFISTGTAHPNYVAVSDGTIVREDGTVRCAINWGTPPLPGTDWVQATRKAAINTAGELWMSSNDGKRWVKYPTNHRYIAISETETWTAAITIDESGKTILAIPAGKDQPDVHSDIAQDVDALNKGFNPHDKLAVITPKIPAWKSFIAVKDFGLALSTDGRVFGVGKNYDHQCNLPEKYTKIAAVGHNDNRYALGIQSSDGGLDFAGTDPSTIRSDIKTANLAHVISIAAGNDRAIAITQHGGIKVLGKQSAWVEAVPPQSESGQFSAVTISKLPSGQYVFLAGQEPEFKWLLPPRPIGLDHELKYSTTVWPFLVFDDAAKGMILYDIMHNSLAPLLALPILPLLYLGSVVLRTRPQPALPTSPFARSGKPSRHRSIRQVVSDDLATIRSRFNRR